MLRANGMQIGKRTHRIGKLYIVIPDQYVLTHFSPILSQITGKGRIGDQRPELQSGAQHGYRIMMSTLGSENNVAGYQLN